MTREYRPKLEGRELEEARLFNVSKIKEKLEKGTWLRRRPYGHKPVEMPLSSLKKKRLTKALFELKAVIYKADEKKLKGNEN